MHEATREVGEYAFPLLRFAHQREFWEEVPQRTVQALSAEVEEVEILLTDQLWEIIPVEEKQGGIRKGINDVYDSTVRGKEKKEETSLCMMDEESVDV